MKIPPEKRRLVLLALVVLVLLCLVGVLAINIFFRGGDDVAGGDTPTPTLTPTEEGPVVIITPEEDETPTPTRVIEEPTAEPTPTPKPTVRPTIQPPTATATAPIGGDFTPISTPFASPLPKTGEILKNSGFEEGFSEIGVGLNWQHFNNGGATVSFSAETPEAYIHQGASAQRISVENAIEPDRYAGIHQTVEVVPNQPYTLTIHGQIRTFFGDVEQSGYGYQVQYAVDMAGGKDWQKIPAADWVHIPWSEELLNSPNPQFSDYTTQITPTSDQMTLFIRTWNKWPDPKLVEYTLDSLSLAGPIPGSIIFVNTDEEVMIDRPLPITGSEDLASFIGDGRFWGAILVLLLLAAGAIYRARWTW